MQPPSQELVVRDLHENTWTFRHIYRGECCFDYLPSSVSNLIRTTIIMNIVPKENWRSVGFVAISHNMISTRFCIICVSIIIF